MPRSAWTTVLTHGTPVLLWLILSVPVAGQSASPPAGDEEPGCAFTRKDHPGYILWVCNPEGTAASQDGSVLWLRTNAAGAEVLTAIWHGSSTELVTRAGDIIDTHRRSHERCRRYVHFARSDRRAVTWNTATAAMASAWARETRGHATSICYASDPGSADFVLVWGSGPADLPHAFTVQIPEREEARGVPGDAAAAAPVVVTSSERVSINLHRVDPGLDNSILRLGLSLLDPAGGIDATGPAPDVFAGVIRRLVQLHGQR